jgi:hypothetical protein
MTTDGRMAALEWVLSRARVFILQGETEQTLAALGG